LIRWTLTGTAKKEFFGISASDKPLSTVGFELFRIANDKIVEMWQHSVLVVGLSSNKSF
jgi:predicted ester cyclase